MSGERPEKFLLNHRTFRFAAAEKVRPVAHRRLSAETQPGTRIAMIHRCFYDLTVVLATLISIDGLRGRSMRNPARICSIDLESAYKMPVSRRFESKIAIFVRRESMLIR